MGMDKTNNISVMEEDKSHPKNVIELDGEASSSSPSSSVLRSTLLLENVGEVSVTLNSHGLSWELLDSSYNDDSTCLGIKLVPKLATEITFSDVYGVEFINSGLVHGSNHPHVKKRFLGRNDSEMYRFTVHGVQKSQTQPCLWVLAMYTFGHKDLQTCHIWVDRINASLNRQVGRPINLLVFVHPMSGKANGCRTWETVAPIFSRAKVKTKVIVTERAGHAFDIVASTANSELISYDGVIAVENQDLDQTNYAAEIEQFCDEIEHNHIEGGDGFFNEILNGFLLSRHKAPYPPSPSDFLHSCENNGNAFVHHPNETVAETACQNDDQSPLLSNSMDNGSGLANFRTEDGPCNTAEQDVEFPTPTEAFRFGIIPAGSTDAIVMCTTGTRDPITSALHIVLGKKVCLDIAQVVRWKKTSASDNEPFVRYAASFAGYGFYGDVITESEKYRWMGPKRYDYAGTKVFLRHRSYEAEVAYIETESEKTDSSVKKSHLFSRVRAMLGPDKSERVICRINCGVCNTKAVHVSKKNLRATPYSCPNGTKWLRCKGHFLSVGAAIISNRNERAPDGLVADAHLSDGFLHLLLIRDCPRASYLWHLTQLAKRGGKPLNFEFVEHHKTPAFTFTSFGNESVWNLDGELFPAHQLSAQVFRGLVSLFASGPEV